MTRDFVREWKTHELRCRVMDGPFKNFNGYVAVPKGHPSFGKNYNDIDVEVHGGLTFGQQGTNDSLRWPNPKLWWYGFDTAHLGDTITYSNGTVCYPNGHRWTKEEVAEETEQLAKQLSELKS